MENIPPITRPEPVQEDPIASSTASPGSSIADLLFSCPELNRIFLGLQQPPERNGHGAWDVADPPTELTPREDWVPAEDVFSSPLPSYSNDSPVPELINENQAPGMADSNQSIEENSRHVAFEDPVAGVNEDPAQLSPPTTASASSSTLGRQKWSVNVLRGLFVL